MLRFSYAVHFLMCALMAVPISLFKFALFYETLF